MIRYLLLFIVALGLSNCGTTNKAKALRYFNAQHDVKQEDSSTTFVFVNHQLGIFTPQLIPWKSEREKDTITLYCKIAYPTYRDTISKEPFDIVLMERKGEKYITLDTLNVGVKSFILKYQRTKDKDKYIMLYNGKSEFQFVFMVGMIKEYFRYMLL